MLLFCQKSSIYIRSQYAMLGPWIEQNISSDEGGLNLMTKKLGYNITEKYHFQN
jgi:hypothetical protein